MDDLRDDECALRTERLDLRQMVRADAAALYSVLADPELYLLTGGQPPESTSALANVLERREARRSPLGDEIWLNWLVIERDATQVIGYVQATISSTRTRVAWVVGRAWQGCGYATEAARAVVRWLLSRGTPDIQAAIHPEHFASQKVAQRVGLQRSRERDDGEEVWVLEESEKLCLV